MAGTGPRAAPRWQQWRRALRVSRLLTEFRNLTERYGRRCSPGRGRGEVPPRARELLEPASNFAATSSADGGVESDTVRARAEPEPEARRRPRRGDAEPEPEPEPSQLGGRRRADAEPSREEAPPSYARTRAEQRLPRAMPSQALEPPSRGSASDATVTAQPCEPSAEVAEPSSRHPPPGRKSKRRPGARLGRQAEGVPTRHERIAIAMSGFAERSLGGNQPPRSFNRRRAAARGGRGSRGVAPTNRNCQAVMEPQSPNLTCPGTCRICSSGTDRDPGARLDRRGGSLGPRSRLHAGGEQTERAGASLAVATARPIWTSNRRWTRKTLRTSNGRGGGFDEEAIAGGATSRS